MAFEEQSGGTGMVMPVAPAYSGGYGGGFGGFGGDWGWIILLLLCAGGGWGNGFGGGFGDMYPWLNNSNQINGGFRDQMINDNITGIRATLGDITTQLCNGFNQSQMNTLQAVNGLQAQLAQCCCDNRLATCQTQNVIATEAAATRAANTQNTQAVIDKLCQLELDGYKREADQLRAENATLKSQGFIANEINQQNEVFYNRLKNCPVNAVPVAGNTPLFSCNPGFNTPGCGCNGGFMN